MTNPICKVADIIYVRFELTEFEAQKKYLNHFGMMLAHEDENSIFFRGTGTSPYIYVCLLYTSPSPRDVEESGVPG